MEAHNRLREVRVTGAVAVCFCSLLLGAPFAVAWALDDGMGNQPFPQGLRMLVFAAAALHFGAVGFRFLQAVWRWEPLGPIAGRLLAAYGLLGGAFAVAWVLHDVGAGLLATFALATPAGWGFYLLGRAMMAGDADRDPTPHRL